MGQLSVGVRFDGVVVISSGPDARDGDTVSVHAIVLAPDQADAVAGELIGAAMRARRYAPTPSAPPKEGT